MHDPSMGEARRLFDRRRRPTSPFDALLPGGRRERPRRADERRGCYFVDRFHPVTLGMVVTLLALTLLDGILTLELIEVNSEEANPIMALLLSRGALTFLMGKYLMTAAGLPFLVVYQHYLLFRSRFRVGWLIPVFIVMYLVLLFHQWNLFRIGRPRAVHRRPPARARADAARGPRPPETPARIVRVS